VTSDAYNVTSGAVDAAVWIFSYGFLAVVAFLIYRVARQRSTEINAKHRTLEKLETKRLSLTKVGDLEPPYRSSGYLKPAGWYKDPTGRFSKRYFAGAKWTSMVRDSDGTEIDENKLSEFDENSNSNGPEDEALNRGNDLTSGLTALSELFLRGLLTEDEFTTAKARLLEGSKPE
jgi:hypothetical protein